MNFITLKNNMMGFYFVKLKTITMLSVLRIQKEQKLKIIHKLRGGISFNEFLSALPE